MEQQSEPRATGPAEPQDRRGAAIFVWATWALLLAAALRYVGRFGANVPYLDEWAVHVPALSGERPITLELLWSQHNEHRIPLTRLILLSITWATGDFRAGMVLNVVVLAAIAFAMIRMVEHRRGHLTYPDAFLPVSLLHPGHGQTFLHGDVIGNVIGTAIVIAVLAIISRRPVLTGRGLGWVGVGLVVLPLCGANGVSLVPALAIWLTWTAVRGPRILRPAWSRSLALALVAATAALMVAYFVGYRPPALHPVSQDPGAMLRASAEFLSMSLGPAGRRLWPASAIGIVMLLSIAVAALTTVAVRRPAERERALGFLALAAALVSLALVVGVGRAGFGPGAGFALRYATLAVPLLWLLDLTWDTYGPAGARGLGRMCLLTLACLVFTHNAETGHHYGVARRAETDAFERDLRAGLPTRLLAELHAATIYPNPERFAAAMERLKTRGIGTFRALKSDGDIPVEEVEFSGDPIFLHQMQWEHGTGRGTGRDPTPCSRSGRRGSCTAYG